jgi:protein KRI1
MDEFENKYNFRFEETGADKIKSFARKIEESVRQKDKSRAEKRKEKNQENERQKV